MGYLGRGILEFCRSLDVGGLVNFVLGRGFLVFIIFVFGISGGLSYFFGF